MKFGFVGIKARGLACVIAVLLLVNAASAQKHVEEKRVRAHMEFLASDEMQGRGSGTAFEKLAGIYAASQMRQFGIAPAGDKDAKGLNAYIQTVEIERQTLGKVSLKAGADTSVDLVSLRAGGSSFTGALQKIGINETAKAGSIALITPENGELSRQQFGPLFSSPANAVIVIASPDMMNSLSVFARRGSTVTTVKGGKADAGFTSVFLITEADSKMLGSIKDGAEVSIEAEVKEKSTSFTWNAVGKIEGSGKSGEAILLSAHMDHLGVRTNAPGDDKIYNGADDDASGCVAVLELARVLANGEKPKRTIYFAFFGSEEAGGFGSRFFADNLEIPLEKLVANLQFEMLGRPDPKVGKDELWLTGYERSDLGSMLAKNGAKLVNDPHPDQNFFERSDNIQLARRGVVAHTVSSYGLHTDYHQASDEIETIDFPYMTNSIDSMVAPVIWLSNTDWKPTWKEGMKP